MGARLDVQEGDRPALVFPFPHIGGLTWLFTALQSGATLLCDAAFDPSTTTAFLSSENCTHPGAGTPFHMAYLAAQRKQPETKLFPNVKNFPGGGAPKPVQLHSEVKAELGGPESYQAGVSLKPQSSQWVQVLTQTRNLR